MRHRLGTHDSVVGVGRLGLCQGSKGDSTDVEGTDKGHLAITHAAVDLAIFSNGLQVEAVG